MQQQKAALPSADTNLHPQRGPRIACVVVPHLAVRIERRDRPELRQLPVVIGGAPGERRAVFDCSEEALARGVQPGMALRQALALCRDAAFLEPRPAVYAETFAAMLEALGRFSPLIEAAELGRVFLDLAGTERLWPDEAALGAAMVAAVWERSVLKAFAGIAGGKFAAAAACRMDGVRSLSGPSRAGGAASTPPAALKAPPPSSPRTRGEREALSGADGPTPSPCTGRAGVGAAPSPYTGRAGVRGGSPLSPAVLRSAPPASPRTRGERERPAGADGPTPSPHAGRVGVEVGPTEAADPLVLLDISATPPSGFHHRQEVQLTVVASVPAPLDQGSTRVRVIAPGAGAAFLRALPVELLPVSREMQRRLQLLGLRTLGQLTGLSAGAMQAQFGWEGLRAWKLARGEDDEPLRLHEQEPPVEERLDLPAPSADRQTLERAALLVLRRLFRRPEAGNRLARRLTVRIFLEDGRSWERTHTFQDPTADVDTALFAVRSRLAAVELPAAAVAVVIALHELCGERGRQESLFSAKARRTVELEEAIHKLKAGLGVVPVLRVVEVEPWSRLPERQRALAEYQ